MDWGQFTEELQAEVKCLDDYGPKSEEIAVIWLLGAFQEVTSGVDSKIDVIFIEHEALLIFITMRQGQSESNDKYLKRFRSNYITLKLSSE